MQNHNNKIVIASQNIITNEKFSSFANSFDEVVSLHKSLVTRGFFTK